MSLPQELLETVVLYLAGDNKALCACLASARAFRLACEAQLFHTVVLQKRTIGREEADSFIRGCVFFASTPYLVRFVKELHIQLSTEASEARLLETVLQRFATTVIRLAILSPFLHSNSQYKMRVPDGLAAAVLHAITRPQLQRIDIFHVAGLETPMRFLPLAVDNNELHLVDWNIVNMSLQVDITAAGQYYANDNFYRLAPLFSVVRQLWISWSWISVAYCPELPPLPRLRTFHLHAEAPYYITATSAPQLDPAFARFLPFIAAHAPLVSTLRFSFDWRFKLQWKPADGLPRGLAEITEPWPMLGAAVFGEAFPNVRRVECSYSLSWDGSDEVGGNLVQERGELQAWLRGWTAERMSGPESAGILAVTFDDD
ncbi:Exosome component Rrp46 [Mycena indigotica]|uniref:Exosome component Rrp46 n=1 Tax=Mycena indigotica TaxID=2126181 RepID=A0A8H6VSA2_9AGAR|nr:Exosome component Rrp46 [Mycena indigotica]KAF7292142.1 Exosome component Rrp46 [Mycena indigotica]